MRLSEIMSNAGLMTWAEVGLVMFIGIFLGVVVYTYFVKPSAEHERDARLPLDDGNAPPLAAPPAAPPSASSVTASSSV